MAGSVNKVVLIGNLGKDPDIRSTQSGARIASFSIATSESWKDKNTGERKENTQWHRIVIFNDALVGLAERFLKKGSKVYIEGQLENRKWAGDDGRDNFVTEVVLRQFKGEITLLDKLNNDDDGYERQSSRSSGSRSPAVQAQPINDVLDDDIPF